MVEANSSGTYLVRFESSLLNNGTFKSSQSLLTQTFEIHRKSTRNRKCPGFMLKSFNSVLGTVGNDAMYSLSSLGS